MPWPNGMLPIVVPDHFSYGGTWPLTSPGRSIPVFCVKPKPVDVRREELAVGRLALAGQLLVRDLHGADVGRHAQDVGHRHGDGAVRLGVADAAVVEVHAAGHDELRLRRDHLAVEAGGHRHGLEGRARLVLVGDGAELDLVGARLAVRRLDRAPGADAIDSTPPVRGSSCRIVTVSAPVFSSVDCASFSSAAWISMSSASSSRAPSCGASSVIGDSASGDLLGAARADEHLVPVLAAELLLVRLLEPGEAVAVDVGDADDGGARAARVDAAVLGGERQAGHLLRLELLGAGGVGLADDVDVRAGLEIGVGDLGVTRTRRRGRARRRSRSRRRTGSFSGTYAPMVVARSETANSWPRRSTMSPRLACSTTLERCSLAASAT